MHCMETKSNYNESRCNINESKIPHKELISKFRELIRESDINNLPMNDDLLLGFIRARKYDLVRALSLLKNYLKSREKHPNLFKDLQDAQLKRLQPVFINKHLKVSPVLDQNGRRILILNTRDWDYIACNLDTSFNSFVKSLQVLITCPENQIEGIVLIVDLKGFPLNHIKQITPSFLKNFADLIQDVFPIRFAGIHFVYEPFVFKIILTIIWPFLSHKIRSRMFFHGKYFEILHKHVDPASLPSDYDGQLGSMVETMDFSNVYSIENNIFGSLN